MAIKPALAINILTLFPEILAAPFQYSILKRAQDKGCFVPTLINIRDFSRDRHRTADDKPYGGGSGMVMKIEPISRSLQALRRTAGTTGKVFMLSPAGKRFDQKLAEELSREPVLTLICGRYEGIDQRVEDKLCDGALSIGDYVLSGGELAALVIAEAVVRLLPGVLGSEDSAQLDSFSDGLLDCPHYTRPPRYRHWKVPEVLLSGDHKKILSWRREQQLARTLRFRPDLLPDADLKPADFKILEKLKASEASKRG